MTRALALPPSQQIDGGREEQFQCSPSPIRRILQTVPTVLAVVLVIFVLFSVVPGSIVSSMSDDGRGPMDPQVVERMKKQLGLDDPVYIRFASYIAKLATGDFGTSFRTREPVTTMIAKRMWPTLQLIFAAMTVCDRDRRTARFRRSAAAGRPRRHGLDGRGGLGPVNGRNSGSGCC